MHRGELLKIKGTKKQAKMQYHTGRKLPYTVLEILILHSIANKANDKIHPDLIEIWFLPLTFYYFNFMFVCFSEVAVER